MSSMPWIKLYTEMLDDPKIGRLADAIKWRFVSLVLLAGECDQDGAFITGQHMMSIDDIAWRLRITSEQCETELEALLQCGVLELDGDVYYLPKFSDRQGRPQSEKREKWRERKQRQRESQETKEDVTRESRVIHAPRVEKSREEKIENRVENISADKPRSKPAKETCPAEWMAALYTLTQSDPALASVGLRKRISETGKALIKAGAKLEDVERFSAWWSSDKWRLEHTPTPTPEQVRDNWQKMNGFKPNGNGHIELSDESIQGRKVYR